MAQSTTTDAPAYFETGPGIRTTIGLFNVLTGLMVAGITGGFTTILLVPIIASAACALAQGLFYTTAYTNYPATNKAVANVFANLGWATHEAGLAFYGYLILTPILYGHKRIVFLTLFWTLMLIAIAIRLVANVVEPLFILGLFAQANYEIVVACNARISFATIALAECVTAPFLLETFRSTYESLLSALRSGKLYRYLMRSTQIRLTALTLISMCRAITASLPGKWSRGNWGWPPSLMNSHIRYQFYFR
ncbi:hypothetical protein VFPPC_03441 [Pochonia chlamydosporia 170]|uniref:Uncharacterized protein n=1 Tax=Pochonia chlamydosporia 170 TaxID=1380566 RepID=A0A179FZJ7_METCM|nr:hypothetical protein VFPPC_03441 [Pochonia chlamydosporia 170]OAQ71084.2 hypothetical protein VFPPC_03441 [Pochonia chlamydosporia 170]